MSQSFLENLQWRFATKEFNSSKKVTDKNLQKILSAIKYSPSSYGLQTYHIYVVTDDNLKSQINPAAFSQKQITSCSHLLIFCTRADKEDLDKRIDDYIKISATENNIDDIKSEARKKTLKNFIEKKSNAQLLQWSTKQCYIALGFAMAAAAELNIDSCPMEGFKKEAVDKILNLPPHLKSTVMLPIGYRKKDPEKNKIRFPNEDLFTIK